MKRCRYQTTRLFITTYAVGQCHRR